MRKKSRQTKEKLKMGTGSGADYKPWIQVGEFGSVGTAGRVVDWKTGRVVHLMSQVEIYFWYVLRWNDEVLDVREQIPLDLETTERIAEAYGICHPSKNGESVIMTTDFLVDTNGGSTAFSVKHTAAFSERTLEKLFLEQQYWMCKDVPWKLVTVNDFYMLAARNIRDIVTFYNVTDFTDRISFLKFLVARKYIQIDIHKDLDWQELCITHNDEIEQFEKMNAEILSLPYKA